MRGLRTPALIVGAMAVFLLALPVFDTASAVAERSRIPPTSLTDQQKAIHLLNRITYGPRPGDVKRVQGMGLDAFLRQQLHPEGIDDSAVEERLKPLETIWMNSGELAPYFPRGGVLRELRKQGLVSTQEEMKNRADTRGERKAKKGRNPIFRPLNRLPGPVVPEGRKFRKLGPIKGVNGLGVISQQLQAAKLIRAVYSERQLQEIMVDFWMNHFNVYMGQGQDRMMVSTYERETIRPHCMGKFRNLLGETARAPVMLSYLDNKLSISPRSVAGLKASQKGKKARGLNENYARELMELHTLGVDGGYTQQDVIEVAKVFTGWTHSGNARAGPVAFEFRANSHDPGDKTVLGTTIHGIPGKQGVREGEQVLDMLAKHPSTARFLAMKLARRFVADDPPRSLVGKVAQTYLKTDGDIREMLSTIFHSKEFWSPQAYRAKAKKPLELIASSVRAVGAEFSPSPALLRTMQLMGEPLYYCGPPTGYPDVGAAWINSGTLLYRWNFAVALTGGRVPGVRLRGLFDLGGQGTQEILDTLSDRFLGEKLSDNTRTKLHAMLEHHRAEMTDRRGKAERSEVQYIAGLVLGSPEFQRR